MHGYAILCGHRNTEFGSAAIAEFGPIVELAGLQPLQELTPKAQAQSTPNTYSGRYGYGDFPLHTDLAHWPKPPRFLVLRCRTGFAEVTTPLVDGHQLIDAVGEFVLSRAIVRSRRPTHGAVRRMRLLSRVGADWLIRWDEEYLRPASSAGAEGMSALASVLGHTQPFEIALGEPGDTLIIDNWRMLHGRSQLSVEHAGRVIQRAYLEALH